MELDYTRRAENAQMARLVQHDISHKKGDKGGASFTKMLKAWTRAGSGKPDHNTGEDFAAAFGGPSR